MKKLLKIILFSLLALIMVLLIGLHIAYHSFSPDDKGILVNENNLIYFQESYDECRQAFLDKTRKASDVYGHSKSFSIQVPGQLDTALYIDLLYIPPLQDSSRLLVLSSGIHGGEAFMGSAFQQFFLEELLTENVLSNMGVLLIHGINPYGFKYLRRFTENNVDLNRGSETDPSLFNTKNDAYEKLNKILNPAGKVSKNNFRNQFFHLTLIRCIAKYSMGDLRQAIAQGQYEYPKGIFFGGNDFEPQIDSLRISLPAFLEPYKTILAIDLHTGLNERGALYPFSDQIDDPLLKQSTKSLFAKHNIVWGDSDDGYTVTGGFIDPFLRKLCPEATYLSMAVEWGTYDIHKTFGSIHLAHSIVMENQGFNYGYKNTRQEEKIKQFYREVFYPSSDVWRSNAIEIGRDMFMTVLKTYPEIN